MIEYLMADGRPRKKVRFASEAGSHHIHARQDANTSKAEKTKPKGSNAKTTELKFFKKLWEQSGSRSRPLRQPHQNIVPSISKQKEGERMEPQNVMLHKKFPVQNAALCPDETPATPSNKEISDEQVEVQASHSEYHNHDTPQLKPCDILPTGHVFTPTIQTPFELAGISRNTDTKPGSGRMFSEKRRKLLKLAAKTVSMESCELLRRRSEFFADILQRLGTNDIIRKHHKEPMRQREMVHRRARSDPRGHFENMLHYGGDFKSSSKLIFGKESSSYSSDESRQFLALPWVNDQGLPSFLDWKDDLSCGDNEAHEGMSLPSAYTTNLSSSDWKTDTVHNQVSNFLLEDVQQITKGKLASANELGCNIQTEPDDHHEWDPMLLVTVTEPISNRLSFPCQIREQSMVPLAISDTSWQPELSRSLEHCASRPLGLEVDGLIEAGLFDNSDAGLLSAFDQSHEKCTSSSFLGLRNGFLDDNSFSRISNFHVSESNGIVLNPDRSCLNSICSTSDYPFEQRSKSFSDSAARISCMTGMEENHLTEAELFDNPDTGLLQGLDRLPLKFTASSFSKYTSGDHHHDPKDSNRNLCMDANDTCLDSLSSYSEHSCKQNWESLCDFSTESWPSSHHAQSRGGSLEAMFGFSSNGSICNDFEDDNSMTLVEDNTKSGLFGTSDLALFGSCSTSDSISETPMLFLDSVRW
ncbi:uncharacterized protein LOC123403967 isoform X1 [Hordeum vulgare subsp. vulgare]|uniref:uncharacterized protein LOC123403967 isoform X1 n=1 Tax=Hordeum vulgare subsp. vulgare TaxID=112509 RepID=UPI00029693BF|nr:uncharacterized protein LOC123403967 isoform X1 [Hordeum vulgare subsp. vulgare]